MSEVAYITIGNSDDKLPQRTWAEFYAAVDVLVREWAETVHGAWMSNPVDPWQNACWCVVLPVARHAGFERELAVLAYEYRQDSIVIAGAEPQFIEPLTKDEYEEWIRDNVVVGEVVDASVS